MLVLHMLSKCMRSCQQASARSRHGDDSEHLESGSALMAVGLHLAPRV